MSALLDKDAARLRDLLAQERGRTAEIAALLTEVQIREDMSTRELAKWCKDQRLQIGTHGRVVQLLGYARLLEILRSAEVVTAVTTPAERHLRPLVQALNRGCPDDVVVEVFEYAEAEDKTVARVLKEIAPDYGPAPKTIAKPKRITKKAEAAQLAEAIRQFIDKNGYASFKDIYFQLSSDLDPTIQRIAL